MLLEHPVELRVGDAPARTSAEPRVQLVDVAVGVHARIGLADARAVEEAGLARVAGLGVDFHER